jgi:glucan biosynthesis protein C
VATAGPASTAPRPQAHRGSRRAWADNLKVFLIAGVIVAHVTMAWTGVGNWVFTETPVREPLWSLLALVSGVGALFGMALFFAVAGIFTPASLSRKGTRRFLADRTVRLGVPLMVYLVLIAPFVEYVDPSNTGWEGGLWSFAVSEVWWTWPMPPTWGPAWFLAVLLVFSYGYAAVRALRPARRGAYLLPRHLLVAAAALALATFAVRTQVPLGTETARLALGQSPAWVAGFIMGVLGGERGWFDPVDPGVARRARRWAWGAAIAFALLMVGAGASGMDVDDFYGGATRQSALVCLIEATLVVSMPFWVVDVFQRRFDHQGAAMRRVGRAAFAAFLVHQAVLVCLVMVTHSLGMPPELDYLAVSLLGVLGSFGVGMLLVRVPGVSRVL